VTEPGRAELPERWSVAEGADAEGAGASPRPPAAAESGESGESGDPDRTRTTDSEWAEDEARGRERSGGLDTDPGGDGKERRRRIDRSRARAWALQILYRWEAGGMKGSLPDALEETRRTRRIAPSRLPRIERLLDLLDDRLPEVDRAIDGALDNWRLERLSTIDRAVLRIGAAELLFIDDIPPRASIQEAVRLADQYGGDESARFVNGVLDALYHR